jgi:uncharacterized protein YlbG (UPF0298 family)
MISDFHFLFVCCNKLTVDSLMHYLFALKTLKKTITTRANEFLKRALQEKIKKVKR